MKAVFFLLLLVGGAQLSYAQGFIDKRPSQVKRGLDRHLAKTKVAGNYEQTDTSLTLHIRDSRFQPVDFIFRYKNNRCAEEIKIGCDSCVNKYLNEALEAKVYGWTKVNESTYVSRRLYHRMMVVMKEPSRLVIRKMNGSRDGYEAALTR